MIRTRIDQLARGLVGFAVVCGGLGVGWGFWESHVAATESQQATQLLKEHAQDIRVQKDESQAIEGAVGYVVTAIGALCSELHATCPTPPSLGR